MTHVLPGVELPPLPTGPTPTLIEYSGYGYADPAGPESGISIIANLMGFTVVDVNMRGTGCSGGAFDFFEPLQSLDGYDVVETIAHQPWVLNHEVGMMGISYGGISQLFTAATRPPDLAAISPLSVIDNTQTTLYPGGILNTGFALEWAEERVHDAEAASPTSGQAWAYKRIQEGDQTCEANQALHPEAADLLRKIEENDHYEPEVADPLSPITFVDKIDVPTFMACQWTDEQTGGHCPTLAEHFTGTKQQVVHLHQRHPRRLARPGDLQPLVRLPPALRRETAADPRLGGDPGRRAADLPGSDGHTGRHPAARTRSSCSRPTTRRWPPSKSQKPIRVLFDNGAGGLSPGQPYPGFEEVLRRIPGPGHRRPKPGTSRRDGEPERRSPPADRARRRIHLGRPRPAADRLHRRHRRRRRRPLDRRLRPTNWAQSPPGSAVSYLTDPLTANTTVIGAGAVDVWVRSSTPNVDLQATISEVRPDGKETFVQNGWVRGSARKLDPAKSTALEPVLSLREVRRLADAAADRSSRSRSRSTTRATPTAPARGSG